MTGVRDVSIAARVPLELRADLERLAARDGATDPAADLSRVIRRLLRAGADVELATGKRITPGNGAAGLFAPQPGKARRRDPATSKAAASRVAPRVGSQRREALELVAAAGERGATADEVIAELERRHPDRRIAVNGIARRVADLKEAGAIDTVLIAADGRVRSRLTRNGAAAEVYVATPLGRAWLEALR